MVEISYVISGGVALFIIALLGWVFAFGKLIGSKSSRLNYLEHKSKHPKILPECQELFRKMGSDIGEVKGKVDTIIDIVTAVKADMQEVKDNNKRRQP